MLRRRINNSSFIQYSKKGKALVGKHKLCLCKFDFSLLAMKVDDPMTTAKTTTSAFRGIVVHQSKAFLQAIKAGRQISSETQKISAKKPDTQRASGCSGSKEPV
jgi:hypothetical protein